VVQVIVQSQALEMMLYAAMRLHAPQQQAHARIK
jgi:hypothetical protein